MRPSLRHILETFDRRWIFLAMGLAIVVPLFFPLGLPVKPSPMVKSAYYAVEDLREGQRVFLALDLDPASTPELEPYFRSVVLQLKRKGVKIVMGSTWYAAPPLVERWISESIETPMGSGDDRSYVKNVDYTWLGFREGRAAVINGMATDFPGTFGGRTADGTSFENIPMFKGIKTLADFDMVIMVSAGFPGLKEYVQQAQSRGSVKMVGGCTGVSTTDYSIYYNTGQLLGLVGGIAKAAEYEALVGRAGNATRGADVLNFGHGVIIFAIVLGNIIYFTTKRRRSSMSGVSNG